MNPSERKQRRAEREELDAELGVSAAPEASQLASLLDEVEVGIWSVSRETARTLYVNPAFLRILGRSRDELVAASTVIPWLHPDDRAAAMAARDARYAGEPGDLEARVLRPGGEVRVCRFRAHAVRDGAGRIDRIDIVAFDVTEQRQAEDALRSRERRFRRLAEQGWNVVLLIDPERRIVHSFGSHEALTGYGAEEYGALPPDQRFHAEDWPAVDRTFQAALASPGVPLPVEARRPRKGGGWVWTEGLLVNLLDDPDVRAVVVTTRDITPRKQAEQALAAANADLERRVAEATASLKDANTELLHAAHAKDDFLANMSHELRTPLNAVLGLAEALDEGVYGPLADAQRQALGRISTSAGHLLSLINDILDLSKVEAGRAALETSTVSLAEVCRAGLAMVEGPARQKRIAVSVQLSNGFSTIEADPRRLKQILVNLLSNAVKFTPEGGSAGLEVHADEDEGEARFVVWDTGIGIAPRDLPRLFKPFVQIDSSLSRAHAGTGLGLALVRRLVDLHGGGIEVESEPGKGSRFTVRLPLRRRAEPAPSAGPGPGAARGPLALIVEDSGPAAEQLSRYLGELGIASVVHREPRGVVERAAAEQPALILLDILLPAAVGFTILRELKAEPRTAHIPVIVVSVLDRRGESLALGAADHLVKPIAREVLHAAITRLTGGTPPERPVLIIGAVAEIAAASPPPASAPLRPRRVLVAEDDEANVVTLLDFLRSRGYEVFVARNGREAIDLAAELSPDAILMDIQMPVMDGLAAIRELRAHARHDLRATPVIALTALAMVGDRERCLAAGADEYLSKPVRLRQLATVLEATISARSEEPRA